MFDLFNYDPKSMEGKFVKAIKMRKIPIIGLPHGGNAIVNDDYNNQRRDPITRAKVYAKSKISFFDIIIVDSSLYLSYILPEVVEDLGRDKILVLGSPRFCNEWQKINESIWPAYKPKKYIEKNRIKIVFFLPRWDQNVYQDKTLDAIDRIANLGNSFLAVKEHTREGSGSLPYPIRKKYHKQSNVEVIRSAKSISLKEWILNCRRANYELSTVNSVSLIKWADVVVCFGCSIAFEVLAQNKILINPVYLHANTSILETTGAGVVANNTDSLLKIISEFRGKSVAPTYSIDRCFKTTVYADKGPHDVLLSYCQAIVRAAYDTFPPNSSVLTSTVKEPANNA
jgi:hypothetical protein